MIGFYNANIQCDVVAETHAATMNIDARSGIYHSWTAGGAETINITNGTAGNRIVLSITCDAVARLMTFGTGLSMNVSTFLLTALKKSTIVLEHDGVTFIPVATPLTLL